MTGFPRERASGDTDPASEASSSLAFPETDSMPHWQQLADAVWLAAYWDRHGRGTGPRPAAPRGGSAPPRPHDHRAPRDTGAAERLPTAGRTTDTPPEGPARATEPRRTPDPAPPNDSEGGSRTVARLEGPLTGAPGPPPRPALVPAPDGPDTVHLGPPLLPAPQARPAERDHGRRVARLARALHRLARRVPSRRATELDERTTAERGVVDRLWLPFQQPVRTRAFDLVVLVDDALTMRIWADSVAGLVEAAEQCGAFRVVRAVRVRVPVAGEATLRRPNGRTATDLGEVLDGSGDRLYLVVTDGLAHGWASATADTLLGRLAGAGPTALVHLLAPHLRHRSSLYPYQAVLEAGGFGAANARLTQLEPSGGPDPMRPMPEGGDGSLPVPVLSLKAGSVEAWACLVTGEPGVRRELPVVLAGTLTKGAPAPGLRAPRMPGAAVRTVGAFLELATPPARQLASQLAAVPFEFDLVEQLQDRIMPHTGPVHLAEIMMGGLIDWSGDRPEFADGVREALLATTTRTQLARTVSVLGDLPAAGRRGVALRAALRDPAGASLPDPADRGWLRSELAVMRALAGPYSARAKRIDPLSGSVPANAPDAAKDPSGRGSVGGAEGSDQAPAVPDPTGEPVPMPLTDVSRPEALEAESPMQSSATGSPALLVNVPLRNTSFVGRTELLRAVEQQLGSQDTAAVLPHALHGMGGVGKSQLALEYVYRHQQDYKVICWIPAEREPLVLTALAGLAARLRLTPSGAEGSAPAANTAVPAVLEALGAGGQYDDWLLVFDNAENVDVVRRYFPANGPGKIIVTSRNRDWERVATPLPVNVFERDESIQLLQKRSPDLSESDADRLADALGDLPLAVEQAGAWRAVTGMLVDDYLDLLNERRPEILQLDPSPDYPVSVAAAWDISLEQIKENSPGARQLLDICASMAPEPVPLSMLRGRRAIDITPEVNPLLSDSVKLGKAIRELNRFSLVKLDLRFDTLQMHRLLQNVLLAKLDPGRRESMREAAHQLLSAAKPGHYASSVEWPAYQTLLPHILTSRAVTSTDTFVRELVYDTVLFLYYWGDHETAVDLARQTHTTWLAASGEENIHVIRVAKILAFLLRVVGQVPESIPLNEAALDVSRRTDVEPEDLIDSMSQMADALRYQGRFREAEALDREATEQGRVLLGAEEFITLMAAHNWGVDLRLCGEFDKALSLDRDTAEQRELLLGPTSSLTLGTLSGVGLDMREGGDYPGARDFLEDIYRRVRESMGDDNPETLGSARNLAVSRRLDGAVAEAAKLAEETLRRLMTAYGPNHIGTLLVAAEVVVDRRLMGDLDGSRTLGQDILRRYVAGLGENHPTTLVTQVNLAATLRALGHLEEARTLEDEAAARLTDSLGAEHVTTLTVALGRANTAYAALDFELAREIDETTLPLLKQMAGETHPLALACTANLALDLRGLGRRSEADMWETRAVEGFNLVVRADHPWLLAARQRRRIDCDLAPLPL
ncbi:FxSxx-COOH system tetratricopeptide repeat protein [Streptomyces sp. NPDC006385]|uniref:FxSxx-COOH system tetratricopeptide repeat protein n=1 Tax=Streptomyces sp. NPDC006385 TaxID=3156761 RepID=UPI0033BE560F